MRKFYTVEEANFLKIDEDSSFWDDLDMMINYFNLVIKLDRNDILKHLNNMKKMGYKIIKEDTNV
jgi:hypothetical protein